MTVESSHAIASPARRRLGLGHSAEAAGPAWFVLAVAGAIALYGVPQVLQPYGAHVAEAVGVVAVALTTLLAISFSGLLYITFWMALLVMQNSAAGFWYSNAFGGTPLATTELKTVSLVCAAVFLLPRVLEVLRSSRLRWPVGLFFLLCVASFRQPTSSALGYLRNFGGPVLLLIVFAALTSEVRRQTSFWHLYRLCVYLAYLLALGDAVEFFLGTPHWRAIVHTSEAANIGTASTSTQLFGLSISRVGGFIVNPPDAGYAAAFVLIGLVMGALYAKQNGLSAPRALTPIVLALASLLLSAAKDGLLMAVLVAVAYWAFGTGRRSFKGMFAASVFSLAVVMAYLADVKGVGVLVSSFSSPLAIVGGSSATFHFVGLIFGVTNSVTAPLGHGLGVGGNFSKTLTESNAAWLGTGSESGWGVMLYQIGWIGFAAWVWAMVRAGSIAGRLGGAVLAGWVASAMFAESQLGIPVAGCAVLVVTMLWQPLQPAAGDDVERSPDT
jgi:hypothetical protein